MGVSTYINRVNFLHLLGMDTHAHGFVPGQHGLQGFGRQHLFYKTIWVIGTHQVRVFLQLRLRRVIEANGQLPVAAAGTHPAGKQQFIELLASLVEHPRFKAVQVLLSDLVAADTLQEFLQRLRRGGVIIQPRLLGAKSGNALQSLRHTGLGTVRIVRDHALRMGKANGKFVQFALLVPQQRRQAKGTLAVVLFITFSCAAFAAAPVKLRTAWLDEHEAFLVWYAKEKGWDKEEGLDIEMLLFSSGMAQLNALPAGEWVLAGTGAVPGMMGALRYGTYTIAVTNDESYTNALLLRPDSPILKTKGYNKDYPEVYGHPDDVRGKTFLITTMSSPHFTLSHWLRVLGLKESDVTIKNIDQAQGLAAFDSGIGDGVCLWAPHMFFGIDKGWKVAGTPNTCGVGRITPDELKVVKDGSYATDKFLKLVKQPIPDYK